MLIILHFFPLIIMIWRRCQKIGNMGRVSSLEQGCLTCWTVLGLRLKSRLQHRKAQSVEPLQKDVDNLLVTVSFSLDEETIHQICNNPDPETAFSVMVRRRRAEVQVSTLSAEQKRELVKSERQGTQHVCQIFCGRGGITSRDLTVCVDENVLGCDVTFKDDGSLKARLVVQGFTDQKLGKIPTSSPTASRRSCLIFPDTCRIIWFSNSQMRREMCIYFRETWTSNV